MNQKEIDQLADQIRKAYKTSDGPRILNEIMREFPYPRKLWNEPSGNGKPGGWGSPTTTCVISR